MKRIALAGVCAALALTGLVTPPALAGKPDPGPLTATVTSVTVGDYYQFPSFPDPQYGCQVTLSATVTGVNSNRLYAQFMSYIDDPGFYPPWGELWPATRLSRGQTEVTYTTGIGFTAEEFPKVKKFRLDLVTSPRGRYHTSAIVLSSSEFTVNWDGTTCAP